MDIWQRLEQEPDSPEVYEAALQRLFSEGQLYRRARRRRATA